MSAETAAEEERIYTDAFLGERSWNGRERNQLLWNQGGRRFVEVGVPFGLDSVRDPRGVAAADFDRDGDVDFVVNNYRAPAELFLNRIGQDRPWIAFRLRGTHCNRDGIGATVIVRAGTLRTARVVGAGHGFQSQFSLEQVIGLGAAEGVDEVEVRWPGGPAERFGPFPARVRLTLVEGQGRPVARARTPRGRGGAATPTARRRFAALCALLGAVLAAWGVTHAAGRRPSPVPAAP